MVHSSPHKTLAILVVVAALALGACGADSSSDTVTSDEESTATTPAAGSVDDVSKEQPVEGVRRFWIKPDLVDCVGVVPQTCMQVAESEDGEHYFFYDQIGGFDFEEGTGYVIDVQVDEIDDPPADSGSLRYTLVTVIEETSPG